MIKHTFFCELRDDPSVCGAVGGLDPADAAQQFAKHLFEDRDGWEWMPGKETFVVVEGCDKVFLIEVEYDPSFIVTELDNA